MDAEPLYPFGFGLSYTTFGFSGLKVSKSVLSPGQPLDAEVTVTNTGRYASDDVIQLYLTHKGSGLTVPLYSLKGFHRISLAAGQHKVVHFTLTPEMLSLVNEDGKNVQPSDTITISIGDADPSARSRELGAAAPAATSVSMR
jgi:beta-glucosidase